MGLRAPGPRLVAAVVVLAACAAPALAQTVVYGAVAGTTGLGGLVRVLGVREGPATIDAWARIGGAAAGGAAIRWAETFGPLGNVIVEASLDAALAPEATAPSGARAAFGVRGVIGPVAAAVRIDGGTVAELELDPSAAGEASRLAVGAAAGDPDLGGRAALTYRPDRTTLLTLEPRLRWIDGRWSGWATVALRRAGVAPDLDAWVGLEGGAVGGASAAALGAGMVWVRRREPDSSVRVWFGAHELGLVTGLEATFAARVPGGIGTLSLSVVPHRLDGPPWRVALDTVLPGTPRLPGTWRLGASAAGGFGAPRWTIAVTFERPLAP